MADTSSLARLYATLPSVACQGLCHKECRTHIGAHPIERRAMERASGQPFVFHMVEQRCGYLTSDNRCAVHDQRPYMCRAYGTTPALACPHGCVPDRWLSDEEAKADFHTLEQLSGDKIGQLAKVVR